MHPVRLGLPLLHARPVPLFGWSVAAHLVGFDERLASKFEKVEPSGCPTAHRSWNGPFCFCPQRKCLHSPRRSAVRVGPGWQGPKVETSGRDLNEAPVSSPSKFFGFPEVWMLGYGFRRYLEPMQARSLQAKPLHSLEPSRKVVCLAGPSGIPGGKGNMKHLLDNLQQVSVF